MKWLVSGIGVTAVVLVAAVGAHAELKSVNLPYREGIKLADAAIMHAAGKVEEMFDSNIFLADSDTKTDWITVLRPALGIEIPFQENCISADYEIAQFLYADRHDQNHLDHTVRGLAELNVTDYKMTAKDTYRIFTNRASNEDSLRLKQTTNDLRAGVEAEFEKLGFDVGYTNRIETYESTDLAIGSLTYEDRNRFKNIVDATVSYRVMPKTYLQIEDDLGFITYYNTSQVPGSWFNETLIGFKGEWFAKANLYLKGGFRYQSYDSSTLIADKDYANFVARGGLDYFVTSRGTLTLLVEKTANESTYSNMNYYDMNLIGLNYRHVFTDKISANAFTSYQLSLYPSESTENGELAKRYDNFIVAGANARYDIRKWVSVEARYEYRQRISRFDIFDYIDNIVTVGGTVGF